MRLAVVTNEPLKEELLAQGADEDLTITWLSRPAMVEGADGYIDLLFDGHDGRVREWESISQTIIFVNAVNLALGILPTNYIRINGWPTFLKRPITEAACNDQALKDQAEKIFQAL